MLPWQVKIKKAPLAGAFFFAGWLAFFHPVNAAYECQTDSYDEVATLERVYDGDTIRLTDGRKVRFIAINTPEMGYDERPEQAFAAAARDRVRALFADSRQVKLKYDKSRKDRHKRLLAHVYTESGINIAADLLTRGYGFAIVVPPNIWNSDCYFAVEQKARLAVSGVWGHPSYTPKNPQSLDRNDTGFMIVEGLITGIGHGKKNVWLDMGSGFAIRIRRKYLDDFTGVPVSELQGQRVRVRGWVAFYNGKLRLSLKHPAMIEILNKDE